MTRLFSPKIIRLRWFFRVSPGYHRQHRQIDFVIQKFTSTRAGIAVGFSYIFAARLEHERFSFLSSSQVRVCPRPSMPPPRTGN